MLLTIINTFRTNFVFIMLCVVALTLLSGCNEHKHLDNEYNETYEQVSEVSPNSSQFCKRASTLILLGQYEMAEQYMKDFGECARRNVERVLNK